jgi:hypothetical protein
VLRREWGGDLGIGSAGERAIYKRRGAPPPGASPLLLRPKRLRVVFDLSASMPRFNSRDGRMDRAMEAAALLLESFAGHEGRVRYRISGHSGTAHAHTHRWRWTEREREREKTLHVYMFFRGKGAGSV